MLCKCIIRIYSDTKKVFIFMGNVGRQVARPFQYAAKTGSSQTHEKGRNNIGGQITGSHTTIKLQSVETTQLGNFDNHLRVKGLPDRAINFFQCLKYVQSGARIEKTFELSRSNAQLEVVGVAVQRNTQNDVKIGILWVNSVVQFSQPKIQINYVKNNFGFGYSNSDHYSNYISRGLEQGELNNIKVRLENELTSQNVEQRVNALLN